MNDFFKSVILESTHAVSFIEKETIQSLWSGYGKILRLDLIGSSINSVVIKLVQLPSVKNHPRGWNTNIGHERKVRSYQVETNWYKHFSQLSKARLPHCYAVETQGDEVLMVLEDLDAKGFQERRHHLTWEGISACLKWLAQFHASFLNIKPEGLWPIGTYWHLDTRPHELDELKDKNLKQAAAKIDKSLNDCRFKTIVHGDAKLANFCFSNTNAVAGVDFQYVGGGCGMKDVAYFIGSCMNEEDCERLELKILDTYFDYLQKSLPSTNKEIEAEWRSLYRVAWADFHRFLKGWSPGHWKINSYSERITTEVINTL